MALDPASQFFEESQPWQDGFVNDDGKLRTVFEGLNDFLRNPSGTDDGASEPKESQQGSPDGRPKR